MFSLHSCSTEELHANAGFIPRLSPRVLSCTGFEAEFERMRKGAHLIDAPRDRKVCFWEDEAHFCL